MTENGETLEKSLSKIVRDRTFAANDGGIFHVTNERIITKMCGRIFFIIFIWDDGPYCCR